MAHAFPEGERCTLIVWSAAYAEAHHIHVLEYLECAFNMLVAYRQQGRRLTNDDVQRPARV